MGSSHSLQSTSYGQCYVTASRDASPPPQGAQTLGANLAPTSKNKECQVETERRGAWLFRAVRDLQVGRSRRASSRRRHLKGGQIRCLKQGISMGVADQGELFFSPKLPSSASDRFHLNQPC